MQSRPPAIRPALLRFGSSLVWTPSLALALFYFLKIFFTFGSGWAAGQRVSLFDPPHCISSEISRSRNVIRRIQRLY